MVSARFHGQIGLSGSYAQAARNAPSASTSDSSNNLSIRLPTSLVETNTNATSGSQDQQQQQQNQQEQQRQTQIQQRGTAGAIIVSSSTNSTSSTTAATTTATSPPRLVGDEIPVIVRGVDMSYAQVQAALQGSHNASSSSGGNHIELYSTDTPPTGVQLVYQDYTTQNCQ
ncbi:hypothetical protein HDU76_002487 [Blyttiomyces sp. JEL0837]|nr:hypothetical protein HDU76_002487 [Blyttiomyces sp. JEL0837]